jgi:hypothetical protein
MGFAFEIYAIFMPVRGNFFIDSARQCGRQTASSRTPGELYFNPVSMNDNKV